MGSFLVNHDIWLLRVTLSHLEFMAIQVGAVLGVLPVVILDAFRVHLMAMRLAHVLAHLFRRAHLLDLRLAHNLVVTVHILLVALLPDRLLLTFLIVFAMRLAHIRALLIGAVVLLFNCLFVIAAMRPAIAALLCFVEAHFFRHAG